MRVGMLSAPLATLLAAYFLAVPPPAVAANHVVGGSGGWCIPPSAGLYRDWADNRTFFVGDTLVFRFETGFYDVVRVGRRDYEECTADDPYQIFHTGPAAVPLYSSGVHYYVCTVGNYCSLGVRLYVTVNPR